MKSIIKFNLIPIVLLFSQCNPAFDIKKATIQIIGALSQNEEQNVEFVISKDSVEYFETGYLYSYKIGKDKEFTITDSSKVVLNYRIINLTNNCLILQSKNDGNRDLIYKYYKR